MTSSSTSDLPLDLQYAHAIKLFNKTANSWQALEQLILLSVPLPSLSSSSSSSTDKNSTISPTEASLAAFSELAQSAYNAAIISSNDELDEIATVHLKYLLVPLLIASTYEDTHNKDHEKRLDNLVASSAHLRDFFSAMDRLSLLSARDRVTLSFLHDEDHEVEQVAVQSPAMTREEKIRRYKEEKETQNKLNVLLAKGPNVDDDIKEEITRDISLVMLQAGIIRALNLQTSIEREMPLLQWAQKQSGKGIDPAVKAAQSRGGKPPLPVQGIPHRTFRIINEREKEAEKVFRPTHNLPTYTIEQWGEIQAEQMAQKAQQKQDEAEIKARRARDDGEEDSDGEDAVERKRKEQSRWDDWKDEHNSGSGNTMR